MIFYILIIVSRSKICDWLIENKKKSFIFANPKKRKELKNNKIIRIH